MADDAGEVIDQPKIPDIIAILKEERGNIDLAVKSLQSKDAPRLDAGKIQEMIAGLKEERRRIEQPLITLESLLESQDGAPPEKAD